MKKLISVLLCLFLGSHTYTQVLPDNINNVVKQFCFFYNEGDHLSVFNLFAPEMKQFMGEIGTKNMIKSLQSELGDIIETTPFPTKHTKNGILFTPAYNLKFEKETTLTLSLYIHENGLLAGLYLFPVEIPETDIPRNTRPLNIPFKEEWTVTWGGDNRVENYHRENETQKYAIDLVITDQNGLTYKEDPMQKENYYCFGAPLFAPCEGTVISLVKNLPDCEIGSTDRDNPAGNHIIIKIDNNIYAVIAHLQQNSITVQEGQRLTAGEVIGKCGNSGNTSEPHIHFHLADSPDLWGGKGVKCFFTNMYVDNIFYKEYSPVRGDKIRPEE